LEYTFIIPELYKLGRDEKTLQGKILLNFVGAMIVWHVLEQTCGLKMSK
jgi:hypothetical protein